MTHKKGELPTQPSAMWLWLLPDLNKFRPIEQIKVLQKARMTSFKTAEVVVIIGWLLVVMQLTKELLVQAGMSKDVLATLVVNLLVTVPLLLVVFIPLHVRKLRRGIREQLNK